MGGVCSTCGGEQKCVQDFVGKLDGKRRTAGTWFEIGGK